MNILAGCLHGSVPHICHQQREYCIRVFAMRCQLLQTVYAKCVSQVMQPRPFSLAAVWNASPEKNVPKCCVHCCKTVSGTVKAKLFCPEIAGLFCRIAGLFCHDSRANLSLKPVCFGIAIS